MNVALFRFAVVGFSSNVIGYLIYLFLTSFCAIEAKIAASMVYLIGVAISFYFNRSWTFSHEGRYSITLVRYLSAYGVGYLLNMVILMIFVDHFGWPHQWVQGVAILVVAIFLFLAQKFWVFKQVDRRSLA